MALLASTRHNIYLNANHSSILIDDDSKFNLRQVARKFLTTANKTHPVKFAAEGTRILNSDKTWSYDIDP